MIALILAVCTLVSDGQTSRVACGSLQIGTYRTFEECHEDLKKAVDAWILEHQDRFWVKGVTCSASSGEDT